MLSLLSILLLLALVRGDFNRLYISDPNGSNTWNPGANVAIRWVPVSGTYPPSSLSIDIMDGDAQNPTLVLHVADGVPSDASTYNWIVPANIDHRSDYFIRIAASDSSGTTYFYSGRYSIGGDVMAATLVTQNWQTPIPTTRHGSVHKKTTTHASSIASQTAITSEQLSSLSSAHTESTSTMLTITTSTPTTLTSTPTTLTSTSTSLTSTPTSSTSSTISSSTSSLSNTATKTTSETSDENDTSSYLPIISSFELIIASSLIIISIALGLAV